MSIEAMPPSLDEFTTPEGETRLLEMVRLGNESGSEILVRRHIGPMLAVARRFVGPDLADDIVQEAFLSAFRSLDSFRGGARISTWLHRIVVNHCLMRLRRRHRTHEVRIEDLLPTFDETGHHTRRVLPWSCLPEERLVREETRAQVRACIDQLPDAYRTIILLRDIEEYNTEQTADLLGVSRDAVKIRLHRARLALRALIEAATQPCG